MIIIKKIGAEIVIPVSQEDVEKAGLRPGDALTCVPIGGGLFFSTMVPDQARMLAAGLADMHDRPEIYRKLAK